MEVVSRPHRSFPRVYAAPLCGTVALRMNYGRSPKDTKLARKSWRIGRKEQARMEEQEVGDARVIRKMLIGRGPHMGGLGSCRAEGVNNYVSAQRRPAS